MVDVDLFMDRTLAIVPIGLTVAIAGKAFQMAKGSWNLGSKVTKKGANKIKWL